MTWRGPTVLALLLALGVGGGFGASLALAENPPGSGTAAPVAAQSPSLPIDPAPRLLADDPAPPLAADLPMRRATLGTEGFAFTYPVPRRWVETRSVNDARWRPPERIDFGYLLRVEQVAQNRSIARTLEDRVRDLGLDEQRFRVLDRTSDTLRFSYVYEGHQRVGLLRWLDLGSGFADVEVAVTGRSVDRDVDGVPREGTTGGPPTWSSTSPPQRRTGGRHPPTRIADGQRDGTTGRRWVTTQS